MSTESTEQPAAEQPAAQPAPPPSSPAPAARTPGKVRNPVGVWLLGLVTLGIYHLVWYYKINRELRDYDPSIEVSPGMAVVAITVGGFIIVPPFVSLVKTGGRIRQAQRLAGQPDECSGGIGLLLAFVLALYPVYYQSHLNRLWGA